MIDERERSVAHAPPRVTTTDICQKLLQKNAQLRQTVVGNLSSYVAPADEGSLEQQSSENVVIDDLPLAEATDSESQRPADLTSTTRRSTGRVEEAGKEEQFDDSVVQEVAEKAQIYELIERVVDRQRLFLQNLRSIFRLSFLLVRLKDGLVKSGLNIGSAPIIGFDLPPTLTVPRGLAAAQSRVEVHQIVSYRAVDVETIMAHQKLQDLTLGSCTLICDLLTSIYKVITPVACLLRNRLKQRRGQYYFCANEPERSGSGAAELDELKLSLPTERKQFTQQSEFYRVLLSLTIQLAHYAHTQLRRPVVSSGTTLHALPPPCCNDLFIHLCYVFENV